MLGVDIALDIFAIVLCERSSRFGVSFVVIYPKVPPLCSHSQCWILWVSEMRINAIQHLDKGLDDALESLLLGLLCRSFKKGVPYISMF